MSEGQRVTWHDLNSIRNLNIIHICPIQAGVTDLKHRFPHFVVAADDPGMKSRDQGFALARVKKNISLFSISAYHSDFFVDPEGKYNM